MGARTRVGDLAQRRDRIRHHHGIRVADQILEQIQKALLLNQLRVDVIQLGDAHGRRLPHVRVLVLQTLAQRVAQVLGDLVDADAAHSSDRQSSDQGIGVLAVLDESVDRHDGHVRLRLGVVHQVEVDELLELQVVCLHAVDHVGKEG